MKKSLKFHKNLPKNNKEFYKNVCIEVEALKDENEMIEPLKKKNSVLSLRSNKKEFES